MVYLAILCCWRISYRISSIHIFRLLNIFIINSSTDCDTLYGSRPRPNVNEVGLQLLGDALSRQSTDLKLVVSRIIIRILCERAWRPIQENEVMLASYTRKWSYVFKKLLFKSFRSYNFTYFSFVIDGGMIVGLSGESVWHSPHTNKFSVFKHFRHMFRFVKL